MPRPSFTQIDHLSAEAKSPLVVNTLRIHCDFGPNREKLQAKLTKIANALVSKQPCMASVVQDELTKRLAQAKDELQTVQQNLARGYEVAIYVPLTLSARVNSRVALAPIVRTSNCGWLFDHAGSTSRCVHRLGFLNNGCRLAEETWRSTGTHAAHSVCGRFTQPVAERWSKTPVAGMVSRFGVIKYEHWSI
jgi:hypothetical protein